MGKPIQMKIIILSILCSFICYEALADFKVTFIKSEKPTDHPVDLKQMDELQNNSIDVVQVDSVNIPLQGEEQDTSETSLVDNDVVPETDENVPENNSEALGIPEPETVFVYKSVANMTLAGVLKNWLGKEIELKWNNEIASAQHIIISAPAEYGPSLSQAIQKLFAQLNSSQSFQDEGIILIPALTEKKLEITYVQ